MGRNILLCDNETLIHQLLGEYLGGLGFSVSCARSLNECEKQLQKSIPDVILLESELPNDETSKTVQKVRERNASASR